MNNKITVLFFFFLFFFIISIKIRVLEILLQTLRAPLFKIFFENYYKGVRAWLLTSINQRATRP